MRYIKHSTGCHWRQYVCIFRIPTVYVCLTFWYIGYSVQCVYTGWSCYCNVIRLLYLWSANTLNKQSEYTVMGQWFDMPYTSTATHHGIMSNFSCILGDLCYDGFWMFLPFMSLRHVLWAMIHSTSCVADMYIDGLVQERRNSSALAMELRLSCTNPSICNWLTKITSMKMNAKSDTALTYNGDLNIV